MTTAKHNPSGRQTVDTSDHTRERIRAFMDSLQPLEDLAIDRSYQDGVAAIQRIAASAPEDDPTGFPTARLTADDVANVLDYLHSSEPRDPANWWKDPDGAPSPMCGRDLVLGCLEENVRRMGGTTATPDQTATPDAALSRLLDRLGHANSKLDLVRNYWRTTEFLPVEAHGAVGIVHDVGREITALYCELGDWANARGLQMYGPARFLNDDEPLECAPGKDETAEASS